MSKIKASKSGFKREFSQELWDSFPPGKYGWVQQAELPDEVKNLRAKEAVSDEVITSKDVEIKTPIATGEQLPGNTETPLASVAEVTANAQAKVKFFEKEKQAKVKKVKANAQG